MKTFNWILYLYVPCLFSSEYIEVFCIQHHILYRNEHIEPKKKEREKKRGFETSNNASGRRRRREDN